MRRPRPSLLRRPAWGPRALVLTGALVVLVPVGASAASAPRSASIDPAPARPRIVGGAPVPIAVAPYQVRIRSRGDGRPWGTPGPFRYSTCGGALIDPQHVVTAAHCVTDGTAPTAAASFRVDTGTSRFDPAAGSGGDPQPLAGDTPQARSVAVVRRHPGYVPRAGDAGTLAELADDVAVLTLAEPVVLDGNTAPVALADPGPSPTGIARVTGFGLQAEAGRADGALHAIDTPLIDAALPESADGVGGLNALYAVTRSPTGSTCQGDSGGPVVQDGRLVGVVSNGPSCGRGSPSNHTLLAAGEIRDFVLGDDRPPAAPRGGTGVAVRGSARPRTGDVVRCFPGTWTGAPSLKVAFVDARSGLVLQSGRHTRYRLAPGDVGRRVACRVVATTAGGVGRTPLSGAGSPVAQGPRAALRVRLASPGTVDRGGRLPVRVRVRNAGPVVATAVRTCVRPGPRFWISRRGGGTIVGERLCWTTSSLTRATSKRFELRPRRRAVRGATSAASASVTAPYAVRATTSRSITIR